MVTKQPTYIFDENGELHFLPEGSELSDHVLSQVSNPHVTEDEEKKSPARKPRARRSTAKK